MKTTYVAHTMVTGQNASRKPLKQSCHCSRSIQDGGHAVRIWEQDGGVYSMPSLCGPRGNTLRFAADGLDFNSRALATFKPRPPIAPDLYRPELTGDKVESRQRWGLDMATTRADPYLTRYEFTLPPLQDDPNSAP